MQQAILLLSGGLDSTVAAYLTARDSKIILALTFDYGQKAAVPELRAAALTCQRLGCPHKIMRLPWLAEICHTALVNPASEIPHPTMEALDDRQRTLQTAAAVWVPNRNGLFLNIAATFAETLKADIIVTGFNAEEGSTFPDNTLSFVKAANQFFSHSTLTTPQVISPTLPMNKVEIVRKACTLGITWEQIWPCYIDEGRWCGVCESCCRAKRAFQKVGEPWPC